MTDTTLPIAEARHALIPLAGAAAIVVLAVLVGVIRGRRGHRPALMPSTVGWLVPPVAALAFLAVYIGMRMVTSTGKSILGSTLVIVAAATFTLAREWVLPALLGPTRVAGGGDAKRDADAGDVTPTRADDCAARRGAVTRRVVAHVTLVALALLGMAGFSVLALEKPISVTPLTTIQTPLLMVELGLMALAGLALYLLSQRHGATVAIVPAVALVFGIANFFVLEFKSTVVVPSDILALNTAAEVAGGYTYEIDAQCVRAIAFAGVAWSFCSFLAPTRTAPLVPAALLERVSERACRVVACALLALASLVGLWCATVAVDYRANGVIVDYWNPKQRYFQQGSLTSFVAELQDMPIAKPQGYTDGEAERLLSDYAQTYDETIGQSDARVAAESQYSSQKPTVIYVMNETFADLAIYDNLHCGYEGPQFYKTGMADSLLTGALAVSVNGGGTCNTEFEALTGESMLYAGLGKYPYNMYNFSSVSNVARQLKAEGYSTTAMHPNVGTNWHRNTVYQQMGFDSFLTIDDFESCDTFHNGVTDRATYDKILSLLEADDGPQFVFDVTMQNHSGYDVGNIPADRLTSYAPADYDDADTNAQLNEYLSCIQASDEDLEYFVGRLRELDRPVILVFWGDHQPSLSASYNDAWYADEDDTTHAQRLYQTTYRIWSNYDVAGTNASDTEDYTSASYLTSMTLNLIGAPLTDYQKAQLVARQTLPALDGFGLMGADGTWYATDDATSPVSSVNNDLSKISYLEFATEVS